MTLFKIRDFSIRISLRKPKKGGNLMFKIHRIKIIKINKKEKDMNLITSKDRVFHQTSKPTIQNNRGDKIP